MSQTNLKHFSPQGVLDPAQKRFSYVEMAYFLGIILVVWGHSHPLDSSWWGTWYSDLNGFIYTFHMQLYFMIGGYLLVHSHGIDKVGYKVWTKGKLLKFLIPYIVLTALAFIPKAMLGDTSDVVELSLGYFLKTTFLIPRIGVWGHFWFIPTFLLFDVLWGIWRYYGSKNDTVYRVGLLIGFLISLLLALFPIKTDWFLLYDISQVAIFYAIGILLALERPVLWNRPWKSILSIAVCSVFAFILYPYGHYQYTPFPPVVFLESLLLVWIFWNLALLLSRFNWTFPSKLVKYSFNIYIYSWPAQAALDALLRRLGVNWLAIIAILFISGFVVPLLIVWIYRKLTFIHCKFFDYLIGVTT